MNEKDEKEKPLIEKLIDTDKVSFLLCEGINGQQAREEYKNPLRGYTSQTVFFESIADKIFRNLYKMDILINENAMTDRAANYHTEQIIGCTFRIANVLDYRLGDVVTRDDTEAVKKYNKIIGVGKDGISAKDVFMKSAELIEKHSKRVFSEGGESPEEVARLLDEMKLANSFIFRYAFDFASSVEETARKGNA